MPIVGFAYCGSHGAPVELHQLGLTIRVSEIAGSHDHTQDCVWAASEALHPSLNKTVPVGRWSGANDTLQHQESDAEVLHIWH